MGIILLHDCGQCTGRGESQTRKGKNVRSDRVGEPQWRQPGKAARRRIDLRDTSKNSYCAVPRIGLEVLVTLDDTVAENRPAYEDELQVKNPSSHRYLPY